VIKINQWALLNDLNRTLGFYHP